VVVQLAGGNDGLNTIVPYADDEYARNRTTLRLTSSEIHRIDDYLGFHPAMESLWRRYREGLVSIIQGVGYANSSRSHPDAMQNWHTGAPDRKNPQRGWLGRTLDAELSQATSEKGGVFVGAIELPFLLNSADAIVPSLQTAQQLVLNPADTGRLDRESIFHLAGFPGLSRETVFDLIRKRTLKACDLSRKIENALEKRYSSPTYPGFGLARSLRTISHLIKAESGFSIYVTELGGPPPGGFDTHAVQRENHAALLKQLSDSVSAFSQDLRQHGLLDRVALITYSEFGRTLLENGRCGTGHGAAAPILLVGGSNKGGLVGEHPSLQDLDDGALRHHTDFRSVYATLLQDWLDIDSALVLGRKFDRLDLFDHT
jgi:uncharacterized protein (DUF1501 family)